MKSILISKPPKQVANILNGKQSVIIFKTAPKDWVDYLSGKSKVKPKPMTGYIYCTKGDGSKRFNLLKDKCNEYHLGWEYTSEGNENVNDIVGGPYNGKVVASFTLKEVEKLERYTGVYVPETMLHTKSMQARHRMEKETCLTMDEIWEYTKGNGYVYHISDLVIFDKPKELEQFEYPNPSGIRNVSQRSINGLPSKKHPPQSWCYVEEL